VLVDALRARQKQAFEAPPVAVRDTQAYSPSSLITQTFTDASTSGYSLIGTA
jgi:hypothetical protein